MKILTYSDLHLEFGSGWGLPQDADGDVLILAGDIVTFQNYAPLDRLLGNWKRRVLYVTGNHEYYTRRPMIEEETKFKAWLRIEHPQVTLLRDEEIRIDGVNFFGGTMWTDFDSLNRSSMKVARQQLNDFQLIRNPDGTTFNPVDGVVLHENFARKLESWFRKGLDGPRVVISHHAPVINPRTSYYGSSLRPAFNSLDMVRVIETHQPALWIYGHTHECDDHNVGTTRIVSNQLGYPDQFGGFECKDFDAAGLPIDIG
jgi:predicted phosphodiesterase